MSKSMGFRNSGKLDFSGKRMEYVVAGALLVVIVVAVVFVVGQIWPGGGGPIGKQGESRVKCVKCGEEWVLDSKNEMYFYREMEMGMGGASVGTDCKKCGAKQSAFMMNRCPKCEKYYLSKRITDPEAFTKGGEKEICPYCDTDRIEWYKERRKKR